MDCVVNGHLLNAMEFSMSNMMSTNNSLNLHYCKSGQQKKKRSSSHCSASLGIIAILSGARLPS